MTQVVMSDLQQAQALFSHAAPRPLAAVDVIGGGRAALVAAELEGCAARAEAFGIRSLWATVRIAQLVADAQAGQAEVWDRHLAEGAMALAETCLVSPDVATLAELAAQEARRRGWDARATEMHALALAQWQGLGRVEDVERLRRARS